jgi:ComF family protein
VIWAEFGGVLQQAIHALKFRRQRLLGRELGRRMALMYAGELRAIEGLVPVPLHPARQRERGYNQSLEIARGLAAVLDVPVLENLVSRRHNTRQQALLGAEQRRENVRNAFVVKQQVGCLKKLAIVDDVMTTGATLAACAGASALGAGSGQSAL